MRVLSIGHDTSMRGEGISLAEALRRSNYVAVRASLNINQILDEARARPEIVEQWLLYSEDKRTSGGWYITRHNCAIGQVGDDSSQRSFVSIEEAVATYILAELDFWASQDAA